MADLTRLEDEHHRFRALLLEYLNAGEDTPKDFMADVEKALDEMPLLVEDLPRIPPPDPLHCPLCGHDLYRTGGGRAHHWVCGPCRRVWDEAALLAWSPLPDEVH